MGAAFALAMMAAVSGMPGTMLSDPELAALRGGFELPNGINLALSVQTDTSVNGALLLRSVFSVDQGAPVLTVFSPKVGQTVAQTGAAPAAAGGVSIQYDRQSGVLGVSGAGTGPTLSVNVGAPSQAGTVAAGALSALPVAIGGAPAETAGGEVRVTASADGARVQLDGDGIDISHVVGGAFGSLIANNVDNRTIDTTTTVSLDLSNAGPDKLGSAMFRVEDVAIAASQTGVH